VNQTYEVFGEVISSYSRAQAIEDGVLVDVSATAKEAGIKFPVVVTRGVWESYVAVPEGCEGIQNEAGRLWDIVWMLRHAIRNSPKGSELTYQLSVVTRPEHQELVTLRSVCGPGDDAEPVITVMLPDED
jgi:hypothetical protein